MPHRPEPCLTNPNRTLPRHGTTPSLITPHLATAHRALPNSTGPIHVTPRHGSMPNLADAEPSQATPEHPCHAMSDRSTLGHAVPDLASSRRALSILARPNPASLNLASPIHCTGPCPVPQCHTQRCHSAPCPAAQRRIRPSLSLPCRVAAIACRRACGPTSWSPTSCRPS